MRQAATVLLLRESAGVLEVLMMHRAATVAFMGGLWVFPGGRLEPGDHSPRALARIPEDALRSCGERLHSLEGTRLPADLALGLHVAACRETFEEAGVLLARDASGRPCDPALVASFQSRRAAHDAEPSSFLGMLEEHELFLDIGPLVYWSHWVTPSLEPKRYDTRFFVVPVPQDQAAQADFSELTEHAWINPATAAAALERGEIAVPPPTLLTLEDLRDSYARHGGLHAMLTAESRRETPVVLPRIEVLEGEFRVLMPWDPRYGQVAGEACPVPQDFPAHLTQLRSSMAATRQRSSR